MLQICSVNLHRNGNELRPVHSFFPCSLSTDKIIIYSSYNAVDLFYVYICMNVCFSGDWRGSQFCRVCICSGNTGNITWCTECPCKVRRPFMTVVDSRPVLVLL